MSQSSQYVPGICNINPAEIRKRRLSGYVSLGAAAVVFLLYSYLDVSWPYYILLFVLLFIGRLSILQANNKFCAAYATAGKHHADESDVVDIDDDIARKADLKKAQRLYLEALAVALPVTIVAFLVSLL